ncbi:glucocorticoid modulatory element-binding protein 1-like isoform X2 [Salarias fasciatus]|nr:glucocorticoid modulatory element-binding protein 1-like isoform X2 [Salarias fasciatus]
MAGAEATVSSGELMTVKEEEGQFSGNNHKTQVLLHLHPSLHGITDDLTDTNTTVLAIETHHDDSKAEGDEVEYGYPITCGDSRAVLLFKKFVCPGINVRCVKFNNQLISPKQFVHLAGKATLKDWKRAIRLGGVMLRKMMDSGQIDFYQHDTVCSNTCRSTKFDVLINSTRLPPGPSVQPSLSCLALDPIGGQAPPLTGDGQNAAEVEEPLEDRFNATTEWSAAPSRFPNPTTSNGHFVKRKRADTSDGVLSLWKDVADSGLMGEVLSSLQSELITAFKGVELRSEKANLQETDAVILNSLCETFGLLDSVKQAVEMRCSQNEENRVQNSVYVLDEILENQRRHSCDKSTSSLKHLRPRRQSQSDDRIQNLLSSIKTNAVIQPLSRSGPPAASYAQLFTRFSGQRHHAGKTDGDSQSESGEAGRPGKVQRLGQQDDGGKHTSGIHKEPRQRTVKLQEDSQISREEAEETERRDDIEKVIIDRKSSKKHKSK